MCRCCRKKKARKVNVTKPMVIKPDKTNKSVIKPVSNDESNEKQESSGGSDEEQVEQGSSERKSANKTKSTSGSKMPADRRPRFGSKESEVARRERYRKEDAQNLETLPQFAWYHGFIDILDVKAALENQPDGSFLVVAQYCERKVFTGDSTNQTKRETATSPRFAIHIRFSGSHYCAYVNRYTNPEATTESPTRYSVPTSPPVEAESVSALIEFFCNSKQNFQAKEMKPTHADEMDADAHPVHLRTAVGPRSWEFKHNQVKIIKKLGGGSYGVVHLGELLKKSGSKEKSDTGPNEQIAIKESKEDRRAPPNSHLAFNEMLREAAIQRGLVHPNVVRYIGIVALKEPCYVLMEFICGGSLDHFLRQQLRQNIVLDEQARAKLMLDVARGLAFLHSRRHLHRDIATRNCLIDDQKMVAKLADFGLARPIEQYKRDVYRDMPLRWTAPEVFPSQMWERSSDVYAFGVLMWEVAADGRKPYDGMGGREVIENVTRGYRPDAHDPKSVAKLSRELIDLMHGCWHNDSDKRPTFATVVRRLERFLGIEEDTSKKKEKDKKSKESSSEEDE